MEISTDFNNRFELSCRIINMVKHDNGTGFIRGYIKNGIDVYPGIFIPKKAFVDLKYHSRVHIIGHINSRYITKNGKRRKVQQLIADKIEYEPTLTEKVFGEKGKFFEAQYIKIMLKGKIKDIIEENNWYRYKINVSDTEREKILIVNMKKLERHPKVKVGDTVCMVCAYSTPKKVINEEDVVYEDIIVSDLAIVEEK